MDAIRARLASRTLAPGEKLPSIRRFAVAMGVSPSTVVEAYDRLAADGLIRSRPGAGFFVSGVAAPPTPTPTGVRRDRAIDPLWVSRQSLDGPPGAARPGCGWLPPDWMPEAALRKALRAMSRADAAVLTDYGDVRGNADLRHLLARRLSEEGVAVDPERLLLTASGTQALDLVCRLTLRAGDVVLVDDPCYFNFRALLAVHAVRVVGVPHTPTGPDVARFEAALAAHAPRLYITNSAPHNPTGATLSARTAHRVLAAAAAHDLTLVEDDAFAGFEPDAPTRYAALDGLDRVIRIGSLSKTLSASVRCGHVAARADRIEALIDLQVATNFGGPGPMAAGLLLSALRDGGFRRHMEGLRTRLARARRQVAERLRPLGIEPWTMPRGGFYLWCTLPEGVDSADVARAALAEHVMLAPGDAFSPSLSKAGFMRFNVGQMHDPAVYEVLERALEASGSSGGNGSGNGASERLRRR